MLLLIYSFISAYAFNAVNVYSGCLASFYLAYRKAGAASTLAF